MAKTSKAKPAADGIRVYCSHDKIVPIADLKPNPENPNTHPAEQIDLLAEIIKGNGWRDRITVSNLSGLIVKGHGRYMAAIQAGLSEAPVDFQDYDNAVDEIADLIADNKISELSQIDNDLALDIVQGLKGLEFKPLEFLPRFGFIAEEINSYFSPEIDFPNLATDNKSPFQLMRFMLHDSQISVIETALKVSKESGPFDSENANSNGNAITRICEFYLNGNG